MQNPHKKKIPSTFTLANSPADPGARNLNDPDWVRRDLQWKSGLPVTDYSKGSGEGINNGD